VVVSAKKPFDLSRASVEEQSEVFALIDKKKREVDRSLQADKEIVNGPDAHPDYQTALENLTTRRVFREGQAVREALEELGYDAWIGSDGNAVAFKPEQVKATEARSFRGDVDDILYQGSEPANVLDDSLRSKLETVLSETDQKRWQPEQLRAYLLKKGVKETELFWSGFDEYLNLQPGKVDLDDARDVAGTGIDYLNFREVEDVDTDFAALEQRVGDLPDFEIGDLLDNGRIEADEYALDVRAEGYIDDQYSVARSYANDGTEPDFAFSNADRYLEGRFMLLEDAIDEGIDLENVSSNDTWVRVLDNGDVEGLDGDGYADLVKDANDEYWLSLSNEEKVEELIELGYDIRDLIDADDFVSEEIQWGDPEIYKNAGTETAYIEWTQPGPRQSYGETRIQIDHKSLPEGFTPAEGHFDEDNVLLHYRWSERGDVFFIDEIQSDWHTDGRKYGYLPAGETRKPPTPLGSVENRRSPRAQRLAAELDEVLQPGDFKVLPNRISISSSPPLGTTLSTAGRTAFLRNTRLCCPSRYSRRSRTRNSSWRTTVGKRSYANALRATRECPTVRSRTRTPTPSL
jgi:hypothetical protein